MIVPCAYSGVRDFSVFMQRYPIVKKVINMSNIKYNEKEEAYELPYKLWDTDQTVRFYVESEEDIMKNLAVIAKKLAMLDGSKQKVAGQLIDDGFYEGSDAEALAKILELKNVYIDFDGDDIIVCFSTGTHDGYMEKFVCVELFADMFEITGWAD